MYFYQQNSDFMPSRLQQVYAVPNEIEKFPLVSIYVFSFNNTVITFSFQILIDSIY